MRDEKSANESSYVQRETAERIRRTAGEVVYRAGPATAMTEFVRGKRFGYFLLVGEPGLGKPAVMLEQAESADIAFFFSETEPDLGLKGAGPAVSLKR